MTHRIVQIHTRWDAKQVGPRDIEVVIPTSPNGEPILNPIFCAALKLTDREQDAAEYAALKALVVMPD